MATRESRDSNFVRLVATNIDLVVLFEFPRQLYCGSQPNGDYTSALPVTPAEFRACKRLLLQAAAAQELSRLPE